MASTTRRISQILRSRASRKYAPYAEMSHSTKFASGEDAKGYQSWIYNHFRSNERYATYFHSSYLVCPSSRVLTSDLKTLTHSQLLDYACALGSQKGNKALVVKVDTEICHRLHRIESVELILQLLDLLTQVRPSALQTTTIFQAAIARIETLALRRRVTLPHLVQSMYYASLGKSSKLSQRIIKTLYRIINHETMSELGVDDLGIFCNALFRSSVPIKDRPVLELIVDRIASSDSCCVHNDATLISFIKVLRHATYHADHLYQRFEDLMSSPDFPWQNKSLQYKVHMLAYFADGLYANTDFMEKFIRRTIIDVNERIRANQRIRLKDLDRLLWSASNYMLESIREELSVSEIHSYMENLSDAEFNKELSIVCNIFFWLWLCGNLHFSGVYRMLRNPRIFDVKAEGGFKEISKLITFMTCIETEAAELLPAAFYNSKDNRLQPRHSQYLARMPNLNKTLRYLEEAGHLYGITEVKFDFQIPTYFTGGLTAKYNGETVYIEVVDDFLRLRNSHLINSKLMMKLRLLRTKKNTIYLFNHYDPAHYHLSFDDFLKCQLQEWFAPE